MKYCKYCMSEIGEGNAVCPICGKDLTTEEPMHHLQPGTVLAEKYVVGAALGEGGFGITYLGLNTRLDLKVAIKEYFPFGYVHRVATMSSTVTDRTETTDEEFFEKGRERFLAEAKVLAKFNNETGIVSVHDFFEENNTAYIVMEYLEGQTLKAYLQKKGRLSYDETLSLLMPAMKSLDKVHEKGLIHRDISPDNIMLTDDKVKLLDFGAARAAEGNKSLSVMLKHGYAPEEQYRRKGEQGPWTDVYALSATIYKCITGATPDDASERAYKDELKAPSEYGIKIDPVCEAALMKGMSVYSDNRYRTIKELINGLLGKDDTLVISSAAISSFAADNERTVFVGNTEDSDKTVFGGDTVDKDKTVFGEDSDKTLFTAEPTYHKKQEETPEHTKEKQDKPKEKRSKKMIFIALVAVLVVAAIVGTVIAISMNKGKDPLPVVDDTETTLEDTHEHTHEENTSPDTDEQTAETKTSTDTTAPESETEPSDTQTEPVTTSETTTAAETTKTPETTKAPETTTTSAGTHTHTYGAWSVKKQPTCTEAGIEERKCTGCGETETRTTTAKGHTPVTDKAVAATCITAGKTEGSHCSVCGAVIKEQTDIPAKGHSYGEWVVTKAATDTSEGIETKTCSVCGDKVTRTIDLVKHNYFATVTAPTCAEQGYTTYRCSDCGKEYKDDFKPALGHNYGAYYQTKAPTCTNTGTEEHSCSRCGNKETRIVAATGHTIITDNAVAATCTAAGKTEGSHCSICGTVIKAQTTVAALGHKYGDYKQTKAPTCTEAGTEEHSCARCSYKESRTVAALGHNYSSYYQTKSPTCTETGTEERGCSRCGNKETRSIAATGHKIAIDKAVAAKCTETGLSEGSHCSVCGIVINAQTVVPALGHNYNSNHACVRCGDGISKGDSYIFGKYEQDNDTSNGQEDIEWIVLDKEGTKLLLISKSILEYRHYYQNFKSSEWSYSYVRSFLNETFYNTAFSTTEQKYILSSTVEADKNPKYGTIDNQIRKTTDKVFILNITEANKYYSSDETRRCSASDYAIAKGVKASDTYSINGKPTSTWLLRTPGGSASLITCVGQSGGFGDYYGISAGVDCGIRPAVWIDIRS